MRVQASATGLVGCKLIGVGSSVPESVLENKDLEKFVDTNDEWIATRTGIRRRRVLGPDESMADHAAQASIKALEMAGVEAGDIDLILMATSTPDDAFGSACQVGILCSSTQSPIRLGVCCFSKDAGSRVSLIRQTNHQQVDCSHQRKVSSSTTKWPSCLSLDQGQSSMYVLARAAHPQYSCIMQVAADKASKVFK